MEGDRVRLGRVVTQCLPVQVLIEAFLALKIWCLSMDSHSNHCTNWFAQNIAEDLRWILKSPD
jgi:hypothetical protein